mgnify:CR=1 FL=1|tara:strand:- start:1019 stop:1405 length:387 start_codon:yes stop_codon:yes gene_type:complete
MLSCLGRKKNTRNCVIEPQNSSKSFDLSESIKNSEELIQLRKSRMNKTGNDRLREIAKRSATKLAVIKRLKKLQKKSKKNRSSRKLSLERRRSGKKKRTKRRIRRRRSTRRRSTGGRRRRRKSRRRRR